MLDRELSNKAAIYRKIWIHHGTSSKHQKSGQSTTTTTSNRNRSKHNSSQHEGLGTQIYPYNSRSDMNHRSTQPDPTNHPDPPHPSTRQHNESGTVPLHTLLVAGALLDGVALRALHLEDLGASVRVAGGSLRERSHGRRTQRLARRRGGKSSRGEGQVKLLLACLACWRFRGGCVV